MRKNFTHNQLVAITFLCYPCSELAISRQSIGFGQKWLSSDVSKASQKSQHNETNVLIKYSVNYDAETGQNKTVKLSKQSSITGRYYNRIFLL